MLHIKYSLDVLFFILFWGDVFIMQGMLDFHFCEESFSLTISCPGVLSIPADTIVFHPDESVSGLWFTLCPPVEFIPALSIVPEKLRSFFYTVYGLIRRFLFRRVCRFRAMSLRRIVSDSLARFRVLRL